MAHFYSLIQDEKGDRNVTIFFDDGDFKVVNDENIRFDDLIKLLSDPTSSKEDILAIADYEEAVSTRFEKLTERVSVNNGVIYFDNEKVHNAISNHIVRCLETQDEHWHALVSFLEKLMNSPSENSRNQLYEWLDKHNFTINPDGNIVAYKGVIEEPAGDKPFRSTFAGYAIVNGQVIEHGYVYQDIGDVVEMPRSMVVDDPNKACSYGLHVGSYEYARNYGETVLEVIVDPRDVVSVPNDSDYAKVRTCRYRISRVCGNKIQDAILVDNYEPSESSINHDKAPNNYSEVVEYGHYLSEDDFSYGADEYWDSKEGNW